MRKVRKTEVYERMQDKTAQMDGREGDLPHYLYTRAAVKVEDRADSK